MFMPVRVAVCLVVSLLLLTEARAADPSGVYVLEASPCQRIELLTDGTFFLAGQCREAKGTFTKEKDTYVCRRYGRTVLRFRVEDDRLIDQDGDQWLPRAKVVKMPWDDVSPVTLVVRDAETNEPITKFSYIYTLSTPEAEYDPLWVRPIEVESEDGSFVLLAPPSCEIQMRVQGGLILGGYGTWRAYSLRADNLERRIDVAVSTGIVVKGTVVDAKTKKPVENAAVSPIIFTPPLFTPDRDRAVRTNSQGEFTLQGVDSSEGIHACHPDYLETEGQDFAKTDEAKIFTTRLELQSGETLIGTVKDSAGNPLSEVEVSDGAGKSTVTDAQGKFILRSPRQWRTDGTYVLSFEKDGYLDVGLHPESAVPGGLSVVMEPLPRLQVEVLDPEGKPVTTYRLIAGAGREPRSWKCSTEEIADPLGRGSVSVRTDWDYGEEGKVWIGVQSPGFAFWDTTVDIWEGTKSITARLASGVTVRGSGKLPKASQGEIVAVLLPRRLQKEDFTNENSARQEWGQCQTSVEQDGSFHVDHVGPGPYTLALAGPAISPVSTGIAVGQSDVTVEPFTVQGRGSVHGIVYHPTMICNGENCQLDENRKPWPFADGTIRFADNAGHADEDEFEHLRPMNFKTDENGRFRVEGVPAGRVSLGFQYSITADMIGTHSREAVVLPGKDTEVRFFDTSGQWDVACKFIIGDGSPAQFGSGTGMSAQRKVANVTTRDPMFRIELQPTEVKPAAFYAGDDWEELDGKRQILLRDVSPGKYRLLVGDWLMSRGFNGPLLEKDVETKAGGTTLTVPLGAGCITGAVKWTKDFRYMIHVVALGKRTRTLRHARCDEQGNFCLRYLPEDEYTVYAHDHDAGWCRLPDTTVNNNMPDVKTHTLAPAGSITGTLPPRLVGDQTVTIHATDSHGILIDPLDLDDSIGSTFTIANLWPDTWTVTLKQGDKVLAETKVTVEGTKTVSCQLNVD